MFVIDCLPLSKGLPKDLLSYFGASYLEPGSLLKINIRNKSVSALVIESRDAAAVKSEIKSADFQMKKVSALASKPFLQKEFLEAVKISARYFAATEGAILSHLLPTLILENPNWLSLSKGTFKTLPKTVFEMPQSQKTVFGNNSKERKGEISILQASDEERLIHYKSLIRSEFAKKKSVFLCLPQNEDILRVKEKLERGIESFVAVFHKDMSKKSLKEEWQKARLTEHPVLIVATASWLFMPRSDLCTIIVEKESENGWKTVGRPFIDLRFFAEQFGRQKNIKVIFGDLALRTETLYRYKEGELSEFESVKWRFPPEIETSIVDSKEVTKKEKEYAVLSPMLVELIKENVRNNSHLFLFALRKGLASVIVCRDCGEQVKCGNCSAPMILYDTSASRRPRDSEVNFFRCHQCGEIRAATEYCKNCGSWKLVAFGAGIDRVAEEIKKRIPGVNLFEINKEVASTGIKASKIVKSFYAERGSVLLGTEMAFAYLHKIVWGTAVVAFDSLFSIPDFRIREKMFRLILQTRNLAREKFLIQSRNPDDETINLGVEGNLEAFYKREIEDRQALNYPPFSIFVKITVRGTRAFVEREAENLKILLANHKITMFNSIHEKRGEQMAVNAVIKLSKAEYPKPELTFLLKSLPSHFEIKVDPDNLL